MRDDGCQAGTTPNTTTITPTMADGGGSTALSALDVLANAAEQDRLTLEQQEEITKDIAATQVWAMMMMMMMIILMTIMCMTMLVVTETGGRDRETIGAARGV